MTDGEMSVRDVDSSVISHTGLATSEDLRWGMFSAVLVSGEGPDDCLDMQWRLGFRIRFTPSCYLVNTCLPSLQGLACQQWAKRGQNEPFSGGDDQLREFTGGVMQYACGAC
jgi:hypothetical protein